MRPYFVIGQYWDRPAEGMQVLTGAVADGLRREGRAVQVFEPTRMAAQLWQVLWRQPAAIIFTHGPGTRAVFMSALLGRLTRARIVWLAPRPDLAGCPRALAALARVDLVLSSRMAPDLAAIVQGCGALFVKTVHGVDRDRFRPLPALADDDRAAALGLEGPPRRPILLHVGHIRPNRGLELLVETKRRLGDRADLVVFGSPTFPPTNPCWTPFGASARLCRWASRRNWRASMARRTSISSRPPIPRAARSTCRSASWRPWPSACRF